MSIITRRLGGALAVVALVAAAFAPAAGAKAARVTAAGKYFGGVTTQADDQFPIVLQLKSKKTIARASIALRMACTSGSVLVTPDAYKSLHISKKRRFGTSFSDPPRDTGDGRTHEDSGTISGRFNKKMTRATGTWEYKVVFRDAAGNVTDTCDSGAVPFTVTQ